MITVNDAIIIDEIQSYLDFVNEGFGYDAYTISDDREKILYEDMDGNIEDVTVAMVMEYVDVHNIDVNSTIE